MGLFETYFQDLKDRFLQRQHSPEEFASGMEQLLRSSFGPQIEGIDLDGVDEQLKNKPLQERAQLFLNVAYSLRNRRWYSQISEEDYNNRLLLNFDETIGFQKEQQSP